MTDEFLTPLQQAFLERFFSTDIGRRFFLTGGTALAAFYLHHRISEDLDLFTLEDDALVGVDVQIKEISSQLGWIIAHARRAEHFWQFLLRPKGNEMETSLHIDLVRDFGPQYGQRKIVNNIIVDAMENIGANKVTAILGRTDSKDFVDLYFILKAGYDFQKLFAMAQQKDMGLIEFYFAGALLQVNKLTRLPRMKKPLSLETLQDFFTSLANDILDKLNPSIVDITN
jgi:predicted nucleotidyltransferase component of viral defense system